MSRRGLVVVLTGDGKGKSTSAFGMVLRAVGWGMRVLVVQFIKSAKRPTGEERAAAVLPGVEWHTLGDGFTWDTRNPEQDRMTCERIWAFCRQRITSRAYDLVVLDEINVAMDLGLLSGADVATFIQQDKPAATHLVLTGRNAPAGIIAMADTVTEMRVVKHAFQVGVSACKGIEF